MTSRLTSVLAFFCILFIEHRGFVTRDFGEEIVVSPGKIPYWFPRILLIPRYQCELESVTRNHIKSFLEVCRCSQCLRTVHNFDK